MACSWSRKITLCSYSQALGVTVLYFSYCQAFAVNGRHMQSAVLTCTAGGRALPVGFMLQQENR